MAKSLPLFPDLPVLPVEREPSRKIDPNCELCELHTLLNGKRNKSVCMRAEGSPGGVLFISDYPGDAEDATGRPMMGKAGALLRREIRKHWDGPVAFDNALRCKPGMKPSKDPWKREPRKVSDKQIRACRGYVAKTIRDAKPERIITLGAQAAYSVLGRRMPVLSMRKAYSWHCSPIVPVFIMMNPAAAARNDFVRKWFEDDLEHALTCDLSKLKRTIPWESCVRIVETEEDALEAEAEFRSPDVKFVAYDIETASLTFETGKDKHPLRPPFRVLCVSLCADNAEDPWLWDDAAFRDPKRLRVLKRIMEDPAIKLGGANEKFDRNGMRWLGIEPRGLLVDTRLIRKIQDATSSANLDHLQELVGFGGGKDVIEEAIDEVTKIARKKPTQRDLEKAAKDPEYAKEMRGTTAWLKKNGGPQFAKNMDLVKALRESQGTKIKKKQYAFGLIDPELLHRYNAIDALSTAKLGRHLQRRWRNEREELYGVWTDLVQHANSAIADVERWGVLMNRDMISALKDFTDNEAKRAYQRIKTMAPDLDPGSRDDLEVLLFDRLRLPSVKETNAGKRSTDKGVLEHLASRHPIVEDIQIFRKFGKAGSTSERLDRFVRSDGRIHCSFLIDGAETGRLSSADPNLQNIDRAETRQGKMARDCFAVPPGHVMMQFDYSQLELRVAALLSGDEAMKEIFLQGLDYHQRTAEMVSKIAWGIPPEKVTKAHRSASKSVNFGVLYGKTAVSLAKDMDCEVEEAERVMDAIMGKFRKLDRYCKNQLKLARDTGEVWTWWDGHDFRRRPLWKVRDKDGKSRSRAEHGSWNTPIQGTASDFCLFSLVEIVRWIHEEQLPIKVVLTVHDSILLEVPFALVEEVAYVVPRIMRQWNSAGVPIVIDSEIGYSWGSLVPLVEKDEYLCKLVEKQPDGSEVVELKKWREHLEVPLAA